MKQKILLLLKKYIECLCWMKHGTRTRGLYFLPSNYGRFCKEFDLAVKEAQEILDGGFDSITQFLNIRAGRRRCFKIGGTIRKLCSRYKSNRSR